MSHYEYSPLILFDLNGKTYELKEKDLKACAVFNPIFDPGCASSSSSRLSLTYDFRTEDKNHINIIMNMGFDIISEDYLRTITDLGVNANKYIQYLLIPLVSFCDYIGVSEKRLEAFLHRAIGTDTYLVRDFYDSISRKEFTFSESVRTIHSLFSKEIPTINLPWSNVAAIVRNQTIPNDYKRSIITKIISSNIGKKLDVLCEAFALNHRDPGYAISSILWEILDMADMKHPLVSCVLIFDLSPSEVSFYMLQNEYNRGQLSPPGFPVAIEINRNSLLVSRENIREVLTEYLNRVFLDEDISFGVHKPVGMLVSYEVRNQFAFSWDD